MNDVGADKLHRVRSILSDAGAVEVTEAAHA